ncbi:MAG TPA: hypothetical protein VHO69_16370 [Phototrophicaceae bacterium]|nr:hypothetical protein [Phototrophicaceae bacterium]
MSAARMPPFRDDLAALQIAAQDRDWGALLDTLMRLFLQLEYFSALEIALTRLHQHLAVFEAYHPEATWARQLLVSTVSFGVAPQTLPPEASQTYASPGSANFLAGLFDVVRGMERQTPLENRVRFVANAVSHTILADLAAFWYGQHPDAWAQQQAHGDDVNPQTGLTMRQEIYARFWLDDAVAARDTAAWLVVLADIEKKAGGR